MVNVKVSPPMDNSWEEYLRFYCQTASFDDPSLPFMASMWSYSLANGSLTGKQAKSAMRYISHCLKVHGIEEPHHDSADS